MAIDLNRLSERTLSVSVIGLDEPLQIRYRPITPALWHRWQQDERNGKKRTAEDQLKLEPEKWRIVTELASLVIDLDVMENGRPLTPTAENLARLPLAFLQQIHTAILRDTFPNVTT